MQRDRCTASQAEHKVAAQMPLHLKEGKSHFVLDNSGSRSHCQHQVGLQIGVIACMSGSAAVSKHISICATGVAACSPTSRQV